MTNTNKTPEQVRDDHRIIFYALLEAAIRYRESFWREDCDIYEKGLHEAFHITDAHLKQSLSQRNRNAAKVKNMAIEHRRKNESFNDSVYAALDELQKPLSAENKGRFDNYATAFGLMCEDFVKDKTTTEIITVCKLYNEGHLSYLWDVNGEPSQHMDDIIADGDHLRTGDVALKLYLLKRRGRSDYNQYKSFVCAAYSEGDALSIHPSKYQNHVCLEEKDMKIDEWWTWQGNIDVQFIGPASKSLERGVVCASFNAG